MRRASPKHKPDKSLGFPAGTKLIPQLFLLHNTTPRPLRANVSFDWLSENTTGKSVATTENLRPYETKVINVASLQTAGVIPQEATLLVV
jgi:hypothetical protein